MLWLVLAALAFAPNAFAESVDFDGGWLGARATGLGGAFTAVADDATAFYWNPAGVARGPSFRLGAFVGAGFHDRGELVAGLREDEPGEPSVLRGYPTWGFSAGLTVLGVSVSRFTQTRSVLEDSRLQSWGLETWDVTATFLQSLPPDDLTVGVNVRFIQGTAFYGSEPASTLPPAERNAADLVRRAVSSPGKKETEPGVDIGIFYQPLTWLRLGLSARNLNHPTFHTENGDAVRLEPQARTGAAFELPRAVLVAFDVDISRREEAMGGGWRELAWGVEKSWSDGAWSLCAGFRTELADGGLERPGFSVGGGVAVGPVIIDVGGTTATRRRLGALWLGVTLSK